jgi:ornithine--oxo-acid transaminase
MDVLSPWQVASTFAATHPACAAALTVLDIMEEDDLPGRSRDLGIVLYNAIRRHNPPHILEHRGKGFGLFQCLVIDESTPGVTARRVAALCAHRGLMVGQSRNRLRLTPSLTIPEADLLKGVEILVGALRDVAGLDMIPGSDFITAFGAPCQGQSQK